MDERQTVDSRASHALADVIRDRRADILARWLGEVSTQARARHVDPTLLTDALPEYLDRLAEALRGPASDDDDGSAAWRDVARHHAVTRVHLGFDVSELVREFRILRHVITDVGREAGLLPHDDQTDRIAELVSAAVSESVLSYVQARDYAARRAEAEHIAFITHEVRNPLTTAMLSASHLASVPPEQQPRLLEVLRRSLERIGALIESVLTVERLESGTVVPEPRPLKVGELLSQLLAETELAASAKGIHLHARYDPDVVVSVDPALTGSALQNVLDNAVKYTDRGGIEVDAEVLAREVVIHVHDSCPGMSKEELAVAFEPFRRGHSGKPGTGVGLAIARRAIEAQGGKIGAESTAESGCHFWLTLPLACH